MLIVFFALKTFSCSNNESVSGVWREVFDSTRPLTDQPEVLYELNLGQYGDRVAGVGIRYRAPQSAALAPYDRGDRCGCSFVIQGLIKDLEDNEDEGLLFVAQGLTFSLFTPTSFPESSCEVSPRECQRIFDLEQAESGNALIGETWCLDAPEGSMVSESRSVRFEPIDGIAEDYCVE